MADSTQLHTIGTRSFLLVHVDNYKVVAAFHQFKCSKDREGVEKGEI